MLAAGAIDGSGMFLPGHFREMFFGLGAAMLGPVRICATFIVQPLSGLSRLTQVYDVAHEAFISATAAKRHGR